MFIRDKKQLTTGSKILIGLHEAGYQFGLLRDMGILSRRFYPESSPARRLALLRSMLYKLEQKGYIRYEYKEAKRVIKLTKKGQLQALVVSMRQEQPPRVWDGKWRLVMFDIPEDAHYIRDYFRDLLKSSGFKALQGSVYISPYPLSRESIEYLKTTQLIRYIRMMRVDEFDNAVDIHKAFHINQLRKLSVSKKQRP